MKRRHGTGSITPLPDGRLWVRGPRRPDGSRPTLGYATTPEQAEVFLAHGTAALETRTREGCPTFVKFAEGILDAREHRARIDGRTYDATERNRFKNHLATAPFAKKPLDQITTPDGAQWLRAMKDKEAKDRRGKRRLSKRTVARALSLANVILDEAGPQGMGLISRNPFVELKPDGRVDDPNTKWTFLELHEQIALRDHVASGPHPIEEHERLAILFGAGSGMRQGEQFGLRLRDLFVAADEKEPRAILRDTKNGTDHTVPLFGIALAAARRWLEIRTAYLTDARRIVHKSDLVWPTPEGKRRPVGKPLGNGAYRRVEPGEGTHVLERGKPVRVGRKGGTHRYVDRLKEVLRQVGITRNVRWHDMRHTCASSLIRGDWGDAWTAPEVKEMLNHSSLAMTDRYAHLGETALKRAAREKVRMGGGLVDGGGASPSSMASITNDSAAEPPSRIELETYGLRRQAATELLRGLAEEKDPPNQLVTHLAATLAALLEATR